MKIEKKITITLFLIMLFINSIKGQTLYKEGYIRTLNRKITLGYIQVEEGDNRYLICHFKESSTDTVREFKPEQISGYSFLPGKELRSGSISVEGGKKEIFFEELETGTLTLITTLGKFYIMQNDSSLIVLNEKELEAQLNSTVGGCPVTKDQIADTRLERKSLIRIIHNYNVCFNSGSPRPFLSRKERKLKLILVLGLETSSLNQDPASFMWHPSAVYNKRLDDKNLIKFGFLFQKSFSRRIFIRAGLEFKRRKYDISNQTTFNSNLTLDELQIKFNEFVIPISAQYNILTKKTYDLYLRGGVVISKITQFSSSEIVTSTYTYGTYVENGHDFMYSLSKSTQYNFGIGSAFKIGGDRKIILELLGEIGKGKMIDANGMGEIEITPKSISLITGFMF